MAKEKPIEIFMPPNMLKAKVGGRVAGIDMAAVKRAELALANLKTEFDDWIRRDVDVLVESCAAYKANQSEETRGGLYRASHDLRGQALTFEFPLVARVASSFCKLLDGQEKKVPLALVDAHVNAIRVIVRQNIKDETDKVAKTLADELDASVAEYLASLAGETRGR